MLEESFTFEKLYDAHKKSRVSKQHKKDTISFELNMALNLSSLSKALLSQTYKLGSYHMFKIYEPKERIIEALSYKDRVVLMAFCTNILEKKIEKCLIYDNVACRKGKGTHFGVMRLGSFLKSYFNKFGSEGYFLKCDIKKYFQSINHQILYDNLSKTPLDEEDMWFIRKILESKNSDSGVGLPIGNQTSQWFGLFYLNKVDRLIKEKLRIKYYVRYMDDMILVHNDKEYLKYCKNEIENCVNNELKLQLNSKTQLSQLKNGIDFLGFRHILCQNGKVKRLLRGQAKLRLKKNMKTLSKLRKLKLIDREYIDVRLNAFNAHLCHSNSKKLLLSLRMKYKL